MANPVIIGIRHHSPACARLAAKKIRELNPAFVLIEGPADFNPRLDELHLPHTLPVAIYSFISGESAYRASWTPFLSYSPEWLALTEGRKAGAEVRFIDLPAWHRALSGLSNRYADKFDEEEASSAAAYEQALADELKINGPDALWDHLFENQGDLDDLEKTLAFHFDRLRGGAAGSPANQEREEMMARWLAWAMAQDKGPVLVICGGYHAPALKSNWPRFSFQKGQPPPPVPEPELGPSGFVAPHNGPGRPELQYGSYLVPYSFKRLDAFQGYASGMPSPAFYQWLWDHGPEDGGLKALEHIFQRLRQKKYPASTADLKAVHASASALAAWRGRSYPSRSDCLDAAASGLIKTALEAPLPWNYRGPLLPGTEPILVEIMDTLAGDRSGLLAPGTPQPPLLSAVKRQLGDLGLEIKGPLKINLLEEKDLRRSRCLHALKILNIPGFLRVGGPDLVLSGQKSESWELSRPLEQTAALIEAAAWGATLPDAAQSKIESLLAQARGNLGGLAEVINQAAWAGLGAVSRRTLDSLSLSVAQEPHFESFGEALAVLFPLWRHGAELNMKEAPALKIILEAAYDRLLWLLEPPVELGSERFQAHLKTHLELARLVREALASQGIMESALNIRPARALAVWSRKAADPLAAPVSRGAALGALLSLGQGQSGQAGILLEALPPKVMGDALMGLLALGREVLANHDGFLHSLDKCIQAFSSEDFTQALPALRAAFGWLPSFERKLLARSLACLHKGGAHALTGRLAAAPELIALALAKEAQAVEHLARWGISLNQKGGSSDEDA